MKINQRKSFICGIKSINLSQKEYLFIKKNKPYSSPLRRDVVDRNGELIARNITAYHAAIKSSQIKNKENFILKIKNQSSLEDIS